MTDTTPAAVSDAFTCIRCTFDGNHHDCQAIEAHIAALSSQLAVEIQVSNMRGNHIEFELLPQMADLQAELATARAAGKAEGLRAASLVADKSMRKYALAAYQNDDGRMQNAARTYCADEIRAAILALIPADTPAADCDDIPDTPEQRALIASHNAGMRSKYPNLREIPADTPAAGGKNE